MFNYWEFTIPGIRTNDLAAAAVYASSSSGRKYPISMGSTESHKSRYLQFVYFKPVPKSNLAKLSLSFELNYEFVT